MSIVARLGSRAVARQCTVQKVRLPSLPRRSVGLGNIKCVRTLTTFKEAQVLTGASEMRTDKKSSIKDEIGLTTSLMTEKLDERKVQEDAILNCAQNVGGRGAASNSLLSTFMADGAAALGANGTSLEKVLKRISHLKTEAKILLEVEGDQSKVESLINECNSQREEAIRLRTNLVIQREAMGFFDPQCKFVQQHFPLPKKLKLCDGKLSCI